LVSPTVRVNRTFGLRVLNPNRDRSWVRGRNWGWAGWDWGEGRLCGEKSLGHVLAGGNGSLRRAQHCPHPHVIHVHR